MRWADQSKSTFKADKTALIHFTQLPRTRSPLPAKPLWVNDQWIYPSSNVKVLGVILDQELRFRLHAGRAAKREMVNTLMLKQLQDLKPKIAQQLFIATVASVVDYIASVWAS
jgi:hypothetical protein